MRPSKVIEILEETHTRLRVAEPGMTFIYILLPLAQQDALKLSSEERRELEKRVVDAASREMRDAQKDIWRKRNV